MTTLKPGDKAPHFEGTNQKEEIINLDNFKGEKLILFFYPKDNTPGCTAAACNLRDNFKDLKGKGYALLGVSPDSAAKHEKFIAKYAFPFDLLADTEKTVMESYGVWGLKKFMGREYTGVLRTTFVIDENGIIEQVFTKVKTKDHTNQILNKMEG